MKKFNILILFAGLLCVGDAFGAGCDNNKDAACGLYCGGGITPGSECWDPVGGEPCKKANAKKCYVKCICNTKQDNAYWIASTAVECNDGYELKNGKCEKKVKCSCANHVSGGACAKAGIKFGKCVPIECPKTVTEKGKTYNAYMVRDGKGGAIQYYCHNDAICKSKGQVLNTWTEGGVEYTDKKCIAAPVVEAPAPVVETPAPVAETPAPVVETPAKVAEIPAPVVETPAKVAETPAPVAETPAPVVETPAKVAETPAPVAETPKTVAQVVEVTAPGKCGNEVEASNKDTGGRGAYIVHKYAVEGWKAGEGYNDFNCTIKGQHLSVYQKKGQWYTDRKCVDTSSRPGCTQAYPKEQAPVAPVVETPAKVAETPAPVAETPKTVAQVVEVTAPGKCGNEVEASNKDTGGRGAYIVHKYAVKGWKAGEGYNDFNCTIKGQHLSVYQENGKWYTDRKCVDTSSRPGCTQAYPKEQAPVAPVVETPAKVAETPAPVAETPVENKEVVIAGAVKADYMCDLVELSRLDVWEKDCKNINQQAVFLIARIKEYCSGKPEAGEFNRLISALMDMNPEKCASGQVLEKAHLAISEAVASLDSITADLEVSKWEDEEGKFNTARLASDSIAGVVLGTTGGVIASNVVKRNQVEEGFESLGCVVGDQMVAGWNDEFVVGIQ